MLMIKCGDAIEILKTLESDSIDCCVTDPPYELGFMGKKWDSTGIAYNVDLWREVLRVLKPGAHLLSFGGDRTHHRMMVSIEDAGFEIRTCVYWVFGSGFPKSLNIGKAIDTLQGNERKVIREYETHDIRANGLMDKKGAMTVTESKGTSKWEGWGTALKPAVEIICMARKPFKGTVAENVLKWGTGGINVDGCRVESEECTTRPAGVNKSERTAYGKYRADEGNGREYFGSTSGRFPANLIHDGSDEVVGLFPQSVGQQGNLVGHTKERQSPNGCFGKMASALDHLKRNDSGSAARFFYCAKASKEERNTGLENIIKEREGNMPNSKDETGKFPDHDHRIRNGNHHPTVKPIALMQYLIKLVCPPQGIVLDPFTGSGSTLLAAKKLGFDYIGIELNAEYIEIAEKRIEGMCGGLFE